MCKVSWVGNPQMILGLVFGWIIIAGLSEIRRGIYHKGPGYTWNEREERAVQWPEAAYRRTTICKGFLLTVFGAWFWGIAADHARNKGAGKVAALETEIRWLLAYNAAFAEALDDETRDHAARMARDAVEFLPRGIRRGADWREPP